MKFTLSGLAAAFLGFLLVLGACDWATFTRRAANPYPGDSASAARGQALYVQHCTLCHGLEGRGDGPAAAGLRRPPPNFTNRKEMISRGDPDLFWMIHRGSRVKGLMPAYKDAFSEGEIWDMVNYIRTLYPVSPVVKQQE